MKNSVFNQLLFPAIISTGIALNSCANNPPSQKTSYQEQVPKTEQPNLTPDSKAETNLKIEFQEILRNNREEILNYLGRSVNDRAVVDIKNLPGYSADQCETHSINKDNSERKISQNECTTGNGYFSKLRIIRHQFDNGQVSKTVEYEITRENFGYAKLDVELECREIH